jgi:AcrR family transcriptional regulator
MTRSAERLRHGAGPPRAPTTAGRRTQAERRARTRHALLTATIQTLVDSGFAGVTTRAVANRAGVSIGALQHHFDSKAELLASAVEHLIGELTRELLERTPTAGRSERGLAEEMIDRLWELHKGPLMAAVSELAVAARTDTELRDRFARAQRDAIAASATAVEQVFPGAAGVVPLPALLHTTLATMRGLSLLGFVDPAAAEAMWASARRHLLTLSFAAPPGRRGR